MQHRTLPPPFFSSPSSTGTGSYPAARSFAASPVASLFAAFLDADIALAYLGKGGILIPAIALTLLVGILSGLYPAFFLSRFQPAQVLKANRSAAETPGSGRVRAVLVVSQFAVSSVNSASGVSIAYVIGIRSTSGQNERMPTFSSSDIFRTRNR